jgi:hypothetical protein
MIMLAMRTSLRQGELLALRWDDVDLVAYEGPGGRGLGVDLDGHRRRHKAHADVVIGARDSVYANRFMIDVASRIEGRVQLTRTTSRPATSSART